MHQAVCILMYRTVVCMVQCGTGHKELAFFFFCSQSAMLRPCPHAARNWMVQRMSSSVLHSLLFSHPVAMTGVSVATRGNSPRGCGEPSVLLLCNLQSVPSMMSVHFTCIHRPQWPVCSLISGLLLSRQMVDRVCRGLLVSNGSSPMGSAEQDLWFPTSVTDKLLI